MTAMHVTGSSTAYDLGPVHEGTDECTSLCATTDKYTCRRIVSRLNTGSDTISPISHLSAHRIPAQPSTSRQSN